MTYIPYFFAALHATLTVFAFGYAALNPNTEHMALFLLLLAIDFPLSLAFTFIPAEVVSTESSVYIWINFALYLFLGTLWYYWVGRGVVFVLKKLFR